MFKRELKVNLKNFIIWTSLLLVLFLIVFLIYPSIIENSDMTNMNEMMSMFPEDVLKAFNMDISGIDTAFGWLKTEGFIFVLLITGIYSGILGSSILVKEENDKTIEYLNSLPIKRSNIVLSKVLSGVIYIVSMVVILSIFNYIGLSISGDFDKKVYLLLSITPIFSSLVIFSICLFISSFTHKTKKTLGISLGVVFLSYFLQILSELSSEVEFLKYMSIFTLADIRNVITNVRINPAMVLVSFGLVIVFVSLTIINYNKKELI